MPPVVLDIIIKGTDHSRGMLVAFRQGVRAAAQDTAGLKGHLDKLDRSLGGLNQQMGGLAQRWSNLSQLGTQAGIGMGAMGAAITAGMGLAVKSAADFDQGLRNVNSIMKLSDAGFADLQKSIKAIAADPMVTDMPAELAEGLYNIVSSGLEGQVALEALETASKGAAAGLSTTGTAAQVLTAVMNAYDMKTGPDAQRIMDVLFKTVDRGVVTFDQLAASFAMASTTAASAGVPLQDVAAGMMTMTKQGHDAAISATALSRIITSFLDPSKEMAAAIQAAGYASGIQILQTRGLAGAVEFLTQVTGGNNDQMVALLGEQRAVRAAFALTGKGAAMYAADLDAARNASGAMAGALEKQAEGAAFQAKELKKQFNLMAIEAGSALLPALKEIMGELRPLTKFTAEFVKEHPGVVKLAAGFGLINLAVAPLLINSRNLLSAWQLLGVAGKALSGLRIGGIAAEAAASGAAMGGAANAAMAAGAPATGAAIGGSASATITAASPGIGARIAAGMRTATVWVGIGLAIAAAVGVVIDRIRALLAEADKSTSEVGGASFGKGTWVPESAINPEVAAQRGYLRVKHPSPRDERMGYVIPEGQFPKTPEEAAQLARDPLIREPQTDPLRRRLQKMGRQGYFEALASESVPYGEPVRRSPAGVSGSGGGVGGGGLPNEEKDKNYQDLIKAWQQEVDLLEAQGASTAQVEAAQENLAKVYDAYAAELEAAGKRSEAIDAQIAAARLRSRRKASEGVGTELGGPNETWEDRLRNLQQQIDWVEAATGDEKSWQVVAAKQQMIEGLRSYATALRQSGQIQRATDLEIRAMRIQAELRKQGVVDTGPRETWQQIGFGRVREWQSSLGRRRREVDTEPRPGSFEWAMSQGGPIVVTGPGDRAYRSDVVPVAASAERGRSSGSEGPPVVNTELHIEIDGRELRGVVRNEVVEMTRGAGRQ